MESKELALVWDQLGETISSYESVDSSQIKAFFSRLHPQVMSDDFLMITADNEFIKTWVERHYLDYIKRALFDLYQVEFNVLIEVDAGQTDINSHEENEVTKNTSEDIQTDSLSGDTQEENKPDLSADVLDDSFEDSYIDKVDNLPPSTLTFENFVIGDSNKLAYSMAVSVAEMPGKSTRNPLFIYGKSGLGKTHLLRAIQNYVNEAMPQLKTVYVDSAELLNDYMDAGAAHDKEKSSYKNFKRRYEEADILLIDDIQYLQGKKQTLDIVFQIFNKLKDRGKQIVLSADRAPANIEIDERAQSRFNSGFTIDIQPPEVETKLGIIKGFVSEYCESENRTDFVLSDDIEMYIAENSGSNIRELKSAVTKVIYEMTLFNKPDISTEDVKKLLENHFSGGALKKLTIEDIQKQVESFYKVSHSDIVGKSRMRNIAYARQVAIYLCRQLLDIPFNDIGKRFGNRDHSTIMHSVSVVEEKMKENRDILEEIEILKQMIRDN
ncbi:MAG: chromosomal replication initiator protein DnaA [Eggerthellaceae bacterium]